MKFKNISLEELVGDEESDNEEYSIFFDPSLWKQYDVHDSSHTTHVEKLVEDSGNKVKPTRIVKVSDGVYKVKL